jgi:Ca2+-binding RTX toxin-like protein
LIGSEAQVSQHTVTVVDHHIDPVDFISIDLNRDGNLSTFIVSNQYVAETGNNTLIVGSDVSEGEALAGAAGDDVIFANAGDDMIAGGEGDDTLRGGDGNDTISGGASSDPTIAGSGDDLIYGGAGDDIIHGGDGDDIIEGGAGNDTIDGGEGEDTIRYVSGADIIDGGTGTDLISFNLVTDNGVSIDLSQNYADVGTERSTLLNLEDIFGTAQDDQLIGDNQDNTIKGGSGDDIIVGGEGADQLYGGDGSDTFKISSVNESGVGSGNRDVIFDFDTSLDQIDLTGLVGSDFSFIGTSEFANESLVSQVRFNAGSRLIEIDSDANAVVDAEIELADLDGSSLGFDDFTVG